MKKITFLLILLTSFLGYSQDPVAGPTDPQARDAVDVISIYNGTTTPVAPQYTNEPGVIFDSFGGSTIAGPVTLADGNTVQKYTGHKFSGIGGGSYDVSSMTMMHIDVYSPDFTVFALKLEANNGTNVELAVPEAKVQGAWNSYDIDLSNYSAVDLANLKWVVPVTFEGAGVTLYLDNVYFWRAPVDPTTDATLSDLQVDGVQISGFAPATTSYTYKVLSGTVSVPQITLATSNNVGATPVITQASGIPGTANVVVTASNGIDMKTYTVSIVEVGPATAAPTPPIRPAANVLSIYSDAYTDIIIDDFDFGLCGASAAVAEQMIAGNPTQNYLGTGCQGIDIQNNRIDASTFTNLHIDFYTDDAIVGAVFNIKLVDWAGNPTEVGSTGLEVIFNGGTSPALVANQWVSIDVDLTSLGGMVLGNLTRSDIAQIHITSNLPNAWYDNFYLYKDPGTCSDGIQNQGETGIDCGGPNCAPCTGPPSIAAPTPPNRAPSDVLSFYSDAYTDVTIDNFDFGLCPNVPAVSEETIAGNLTQHYLGGGCQGIDIQNNRIDASAFTNLHIDFYTGDTDLIGKVFNLKLVDWAGNPTEVGSTGLEVIFNGGTSPALVANQWVSIDVDITSLGGMVLGNLTRSNLAQIHITSNLSNVWYDNLYLHKGTTLDVEDNEFGSFTTYPNPTQDSWMVKSKRESISSIKIYDISGKNVLSLSPNKNEAIIDATSLKAGLYFARIKTASGLRSLKLVKK